MSRIFIIEDVMHAEHVSEHRSIEDVWMELSRMSEIPWGLAPNCVPCSAGDACERSYEIHEYDDVASPWVHIRDIGGFDISAKGVVWDDEPVWNELSRSVP